MNHFKNNSSRPVIALICLLMLVPSLGACVEQQLSNSEGGLQASSPGSVNVAQLSPAQQGALAAPLLPPPLEAAPIESPEKDLVISPLNENRFSAPPAPPLNPDVPRVAILLPLSGQHAKLGQAMLNAAQLALFHFADKQFELLPQDTRGTTTGAADAAALAIGDGASLILGPLFAGSVEAVSPAARAAGIKVIAFSNDRTIAGDGIFTMGFLPSEQVQRVVTFAIQKGVRRFAVLAPDNYYGVTIADALKQTAEANGAEVTQQAFYDPYVTDFAPVIKNLANYDVRRQSLLAERKLLEERDDEVAKQALKRLENLQTLGDVSFEALLIADGGKRLQSIAALLPYYDIDPKKIRMLGTGQWDAPGIGSEPALVGGWYAAPAVRERHQFMRQYKAIYGDFPPRLATLAYDATALAAVFAQSTGKGEGEAAKTVFELSEITAPQGFMGRDGIFRFLTAGVAERGLSVLQVRERDSKTVSQAPRSFEGGAQ
jgi:branched-chain amino acid transport system substrate-binding protein